MLRFHGFRCLIYIRRFKVYTFSISGLGFCILDLDFGFWVLDLGFGVWGFWI